MELISYLLGKKAGGGGGTDTSDANATASDIALGKSGYVKGVKINGNVPIGSPVIATNYGSSNVSTYLDDLKVDATQGNTNQFFYTGDKISVLAPLNDVAPVVGATAEKIKKDEVICGVIGTYEGSGGSEVEEKDVNFYDYLGNRVYSYTAQEFANLSALPEAPTHDGMTFQEWNWELADAKTYVSTYGALEIGETCTTSDGKTRIYIELSKDRYSITLQFAINGTATVNWGDGSAEETMTGTSTSTAINKSHNYTQPGNYIITINSNTNVIFTSAVFTPNSQLVFITKIELGDNFTLGLNALGSAFNLKSINLHKYQTSLNYNNVLNYCYSLEYITIPKTLSAFRSSGFSHCYNLKRISLPTGIYTISANLFEYTSLEKITLPDTITGISSSAFAYCSKLRKIILPSGYSATNSSIFDNCRSLTYVKALGNITNLKNNPFNYCINIKTLDLRNNTSVPQKDSYIFNSGEPADFQMVVPDALYDDMATAFGSSKVIKASEYTG